MDNLISISVIIGFVFVAYASIWKYKHVSWLRLSYRLSRKKCETYEKIFNIQHNRKNIFFKILRKWPSNKKEFYLRTNTFTDDNLL